VQATDEFAAANVSATVARSTLLDIASSAADAAAAIIRERAGDARTMVWERKSHSDFVTEVDTAAERAIREVVHALLPDAEVLGEELSPGTVPRGITFVVDPLDGTTNFLHGLPWYAVSIAALVDGELAAGAIINVATGALFTATAGGGARHAGAPIRVSTITDPSRALIATGFPFSREEEIARYVPMLPAVMRATAGIRRCGAAALDLADVAAGRYEAFFELRLSPWDIAAGLLLVREAGGIATTLEGRECPVAETSVVAGNPVMHEWLMRTVNGEP
jgi:myo-inositol-1(or 4)-monophosphatase